MVRLPQGTKARDVHNKKTKIPRDLEGDIVTEDSVILGVRTKDGLFFVEKVDLPSEEPEPEEEAPAPEPAPALVELFRFPVIEPSPEDEEVVDQLVRAKTKPTRRKRIKLPPKKQPKPPAPKPPNKIWRGIKITWMVYVALSVFWTTLSIVVALTR